MHTRCLGDGERDTWNAFVASSPYGHILQSWEWGEVKSRTGQEPIRMALADAGGIRAAAQILLRKVPGGVGAIAYVPKGPVVDYGDRSLLGATLDALRGVAAERNVISVKIEPEIPEPNPVTDALTGAGWSPTPPIQMRSTIWVDLDMAEEEIMARQKQKTRYNIRLASKKGVTITSGGVDDVDSWYSLYQDTSERDAFTIHDRNYYRTVMEVLGPPGMANLLLAHHDGDLLAGIIVFCFGRTAQYMYGASGNLKRNLMAPYLLQWEGMRWAKSRGAITYDLWGIPDRLEENEDLWGVYRHKRGYGGEIVRYVGAFDLVNAPLRHWALENVARPLFKRVARLSV